LLRSPYQLIPIAFKPSLYMGIHATVNVAVLIKQFE